MTIRFIGLKRGGGKTTEAIKRSAETGKYILCNGRAQADFIHRYALEMGYKIPFPITVEEVLDKKTSQALSDEGVIIDNIESVLYRILKCSVDTITFTINDDQNKKGDTMTFSEELMRLRAESHEKWFDRFWKNEKIEHQLRVSAKKIKEKLGQGFSVKLEVIEGRNIFGNRFISDEYIIISW